MSIQLGYVCRNETLQLKCNRSMIRRNFTLALAQSYALQNIAELHKIFEWNDKHNIRVFRLTSDLFPHFTDNGVNEVKTGEYNLDFARQALREAGECAKKYGQRLSMHPGQYNQIASPSQDVWEATVRDLKYHADVMDAMGLGQESVICIHGGGVYNDIETTKKRWIERFFQLPENVKARIAIENCERCYSVVDCLELAEACVIPLIFDCHHYECYNLLKPTKACNIDEYMPRVVKTWHIRELTPLFHISEQAPNERIGTHSEYVQKLPPYYLAFPQQFGNLDIEVEAGAKDKSVLKLRETF